MEEYHAYGVGPGTAPLWFDLCDEQDEKRSSSLGFVELLHLQQAQDHHHDDDDDDSALKQQQQPPSTTNSSSISSASSEVAPLHDEQHNHHHKTVDQPPPQSLQHQNATNKLLKAKKTNQKRQKEPRFAFMTKSEVDHLEDGFRWRKYGQKAVKNSPFPRSYYRCTSGSCSVKKRVERSLTDPSVVVTTYEGKHTHPSPTTMVRSGGLNNNPAIAENYLSQYYYDQQQLNHQQQILFSTLSSSSGFPPPPFSQGRPPVCNLGGINKNALLLRDHGLLQDVVPSHMLKEEE